jgi:AcrR family transcriptional regulator
VADARREQAIAAARALLEAEGEGALSMRRIAAELGMRAPSLYKHMDDKSALEVALITEGITELGEALTGAGPSLADMALAYRSYALDHPHLYVLMTQRPLPRDRLPEGLEERAAIPLRAVLPDENQARAVWAAAHGLTILELNGRFPPGADLDAAWAATVAAFRPDCPASVAGEHH